MGCLMAWNSSRVAVRAVWGPVRDVRAVLSYLSQAALAAWVVIRTAGGVCGNRVHSEQRHGPRWVDRRSLGARHLWWSALLYSVNTWGSFRVRVVHPAHGVLRGGGARSLTRTNPVGLSELVEVRATRMIVPWRKTAGDVVGWKRTRRPKRWARQGPPRARWGAGLWWIYGSS